MPLVFGGGICDSWINILENVQAAYLVRVTFINTTNLFTLMLCPVYVTSFTRYYCILTLYVPLT